jgi:SAM-dependent methyltransferase
MDSIENLGAIVGDRRFDLVCAHSLLMYLDDRAAAIGALARSKAERGLVSLTFRNRHALAMRPGLRREWAAALAAFGETSYVNELGVRARADLLDDVVADLDRCGMNVVDWYGVRVFNEAVDPGVGVADEEHLAELLDAEEQAGRSDP